MPDLVWDGKYDNDGPRVAPPAPFRHKQIMTRHAISESTFHRARREAISALAREISEQEAALAFPAAASPVSGLSPTP